MAPFYCSCTLSSLVVVLDDNNINDDDDDDDDGEGDRYSEHDDVHVI